MIYECLFFVYNFLAQSRKGSHFRRKGRRREAQGTGTCCGVPSWNVPCVVEKETRRVRRRGNGHQRADSGEMSGYRNAMERSARVLAQRVAGAPGNGLLWQGAGVYGGLLASESQELLHLASSLVVFGDVCDTRLDE